MRAGDGAGRPPLGQLARRALRRLPGAQRAALTARFGDLRRTEPLTRWGYDRGTPVDRWYIDRYLQENRQLVHGRVLEVKADHYASRLGAAEVEVVDIDVTNPRATVLGDLCQEATLQRARYDAAIVTQTLQLVADPEAALRTLLQGLRPGGALLLTVPCLSRICDGSDAWRWTPAGFGRLLSRAAPRAEAEWRGLGNGLAARAFLFGLAAEDLSDEVLAVQDPDFPLVVGACVRLPDPA